MHQPGGDADVEVRADGTVVLSGPSERVAVCLVDVAVMGPGSSMSLIERSFREKIVLVGVALRRASLADTEDHLDELALLVDTAGADEAARVVQRRDRPDPATYVG